MKAFFSLLTLLYSCLCASDPKVRLGVDVFFEEGGSQSLKGKRVALVINQTSYSSRLERTYDLFKRSEEVRLVALFTPEHGFNGAAYSGEAVAHSRHEGILSIYSLHGETRRPTPAMLKNVDVIVFDIQEIGSRSYTYASTLFYLMEEVAKHNIKLIVLDRPNPMGGSLIDGPMLKREWRSFLGYINTPYCHGMTLGELALFFNREYKIGCALQIVKMKGWKRGMSFRETGLSWIPSSPRIPEWDTPYFYATTGILGELGLVNIGMGCAQPFKIVGAPWIQGEILAKKLNAQNLPGVKFIPTYFRPHYGFHEKQECQGVKIIITDYATYQPVTAQYLILGVLKSLYPEKVTKALTSLSSAKRKLFCCINGTEAVLEILQSEAYPAWKLMQIGKKERANFAKKREAYLLY